MHDDGVFADRAAAGAALAERLRKHGVPAGAVVLALPRGGVPVAAPVARLLAAPLDILCVRKVGVPGQPELAMGAVAAGGTVVRNAAARVEDPVFDAAAARERTALAEQERRLRAGRPAAALTGRPAVIVDDGLATGATMLAAVHAARAAGAGPVLVAVPVAAEAALAALAAVADGVVCVETPADFRAVGAYYADFDPVAEEQVVALLAGAVPGGRDRGATRHDGAVAVSGEHAPWPRHLLLVRHGESLGNVAHDEAYAAHAPRLDLDVPDAEVALSELGVRQAGALGRRMADEPRLRPTVVFTSPYRRAQQTAAAVLAAAGLDGLPRLVDERLRDREQGSFDRLTWYGITEEFPAEAERRRALGKFWYRPPGGESWADVALRLRSLLHDLRADHAGADVLLVTHDVPILLMRYLLEGLDAAAAVALSGQVANCATTRYHAGPGGLELDWFNDTAPVAADPGTAVTARE